MSEMTGILAATAARLFADVFTREVREAAERGAWPGQAWDSLESMGLTGAATSEARGGAGADAGDVFALAQLAGACAIPVPYTETLLAEQLLAAANLPVVPGPATVGPVLRRDRLSLSRRGKGWQVDGTLHRVPWARSAKSLVVVAQYEGRDRTVLIRQIPHVEEGWNYAREPRDTVRLDQLTLPDDAVGEGASLGCEELYFRGALMRALMMAGALNTVLELTVRYAKERVQFGKPIGKFQAVQQQIAALASQVAASSAAAEAAADASRERPAHFQIAAAKARISEAVAAAVGIAHQVHAAMGFTHEHPLHYSTRRLLAWRDEFGTEAEWSAWVGNVIARVGGESLWSYLTQPAVPGGGFPAP